MIINGFKPFIGQHCETTALGNLLQHAGMALSEPMIFGLGQGLGFIYWDMKKMGFPFIGGRAKPDAITRNFCQRLKIPVSFAKTSSAAKAWKNVADVLAKGQPVGLKLDCYYLDYFTNKIHFAAHYAALYGFDNTFAYLADTHQQGPLVKTRLASLAASRLAKGPMSTPGLSFSLTLPVNPLDLRECLKPAIRDNAAAYLEAPIQNLGPRGIEKMSREVLGWFKRSKNIPRDFSLCALLMERGGTGGGLFRKIYASFLAEAGQTLNNPLLRQSASDFAEIARQWTETASLIESAGRTQEEQYLQRLSGLLLQISQAEKQVMTSLAGV